MSFPYKSTPSRKKLLLFILLTFIYNCEEKHLVVDSKEIKSNSELYIYLLPK